MDLEKMSKFEQAFYRGVSIAGAIIAGVSILAVSIFGLAKLIQLLVMSW